MITRLALSAVLLTVLTNSPASATPLNYKYWHEYKAYQTQSHYRAFAYARGTIGAKGPMGWATGSASSEKSVQAAIDAALAKCEAKRLTAVEGGVPNKCRNYAIGQIEVFLLTEPQLSRAIAVYAENPSATNADLLANAAQAAEVK